MKHLLFILVMASACVAQVGFGGEPKDNTEKINKLIEGLKSGNSSTQFKSAKFLSRYGPEAKAAVPALLNVLKHGKEYPRIAAAIALARIGPEAKAAVSDLRVALRDKSGKVRQAAAAALGSVGPEAKAAVPDLRKALKEDRVSVRVSAAGALGLLGEKMGTVMPILLAALKNERGAVQQNAALSLGKLGPKAKSAVPALIVALKYKDASVRMYSVVALAKIGPETDKVLQAIKGALKDKDEKVRKCAAHYLEIVRPSIHISTYDTEDPVEVGKLTTYVIVARNEGTLPCTNVAITSELPSIVSFVSAKGPTAHKVEKQRVSFEAVPILQPGDKLTFKITGKAMKAGGAKLRTALRYDQLKKEIIDEEGTSLYK
jgi:uncharacterized repeat protein (TIGR01451 family)